MISFFKWVSNLSLSRWFLLQLFFQIGTTIRNWRSKNSPFFPVSLSFVAVRSCWRLCLASALEDDTNKEWVEMDKRWLEEQRREFHEMDIDTDGILTREELLVSPSTCTRDDRSACVIVLESLRSDESCSYRQSNQKALRLSRWFSSRSISFPRGNSKACRCLHGYAYSRYWQSITWWNVNNNFSFSMICFVFLCFSPSIH